MAALSVSSPKAAAESALMLRNILVAVNPRAVLLIRSAYQLFRRFHCEPHSVTQDQESRIFTPNGSNRACVFLSARARVLGLHRSVPLFVVGHPSKFGSRVEWSKVNYGRMVGHSENGRSSGSLLGSPRRGERFPPIEPVSRKVFLESVLGASSYQQLFYTSVGTGSGTVPVRDCILMAGSLTTLSGPAAAAGRRWW